MGLIDVLNEKLFRYTVSITAGRGRVLGKKGELIVVYSLFQG